MMTTVTIPQVETPDAEKLEDLSVMYWPRLKLSSRWLHPRLLCSNHQIFHV